MDKTRAIWIHIFRTFAIVIVLAVAYTLVSKLNSMPVWVLFGMIVVYGWYKWAKWSARWAPVCKLVKSYPWTADDGRKFETVLELAQLSSPVFNGAHSVRTEIYRISIYQLIPEDTGRKLSKRILLDDRDNSIFLGIHDNCFCFYCESAFYGGPNARGLSKRDRETGDLVFLYSVKATEYCSHSGSIITLTEKVKHSESLKLEFDLNTARN